MDFEAFVRLLEECDGQEVQVVVNPAGPLTALFGGELWHEKEWVYVDEGEGDPLTGEEIAVVVGCRLDGKDAGSFRISEAIYVSAVFQDVRTLLVTTVGGEVEIEADGPQLSGSFFAESP